VSVHRSANGYKSWYRKRGVALPEKFVTDVTGFA